MKHADLLDENCAVARSAAIVGERWVWVILRQAFNGARRFEDFQRGIGLARNVLTERLNRLVEHGVLERRRYSEHTARDLNEYRLTAKGRALFPVYVALMNWGNQWTGLPLHRWICCTSPVGTGSAFGRVLGVRSGHRCPRHRARCRARPDHASPQPV